MAEQWKQIPDYDKYEISSLGQVRSHHLKRGKVAILKPNITGKGYQFVNLFKTCGSKKSFYIHRLVATAFIDSSDETLHVNHIDLNKQNNNVENLEWVTRKGNAQHALKNGRYLLVHSGGRTIARNNPNCAKKLTVEQADAIKAACTTEMSQAEIAKIYGITASTVSKIKRGAIWADKARISSPLLIYSDLPLHAA